MAFPVFGDFLRGFAVSNRPLRPSRFRSWIKRIDSSYKLNKFLSGRRSSVEVNVATVELRFRAVVLIGD